MESKIYKCNVCPYEGRNKDSLRGHIKNKHKRTKEEVDCKLCHQIFNHPTSLKCHLNTIHRKIRYKCNLCDYEATQRGNLCAHKKSIHDKIRHPCNICNREFTQKSHLKTHQRGFHQMGEKYECNYCDYSTALKGHLTEHRKSIHENIIYNCTLCDPYSGRIPLTRELEA